MKFHRVQPPPTPPPHHTQNQHHHTEGKSVPINRFHLEFVTEMSSNTFSAKHVLNLNLIIPRIKEHITSTLMLLLD